MNEIKKVPGVRARIPIAILILSYVALHLILSFAFAKNFVFAVHGYKILGILPILLLGIYLLSMYKVHSPTPYVVFAMLGIGFGSTSFGLGVSWVTGSYNFCYQTLNALIEGKISLLSVREWSYFIAGIAHPLLIISIFFLIKGGRAGKILLTVTSALCCLETLLYAAGMVEYTNRIGYNYRAVEYLNVLAPILFYTALILYAAFNMSSEREPERVMQ